MLAISSACRWREKQEEKYPQQNSVFVSRVRVWSPVAISFLPELYINEKRIELEARALLATILRYRKQTDQWLAATNSINSVLKEIGDFENWMKIMDFDCKSINTAIRTFTGSDSACD
ncbi:hypothetical protein GUJ93_ZPchr0011g27471 [Zizania palustris]|uniref:Biogenesis of lysosome-related organelles complex 1 subunit 1 n=1 Tax=Zizania palustris TaxID=103762 RepID=A0A8J5WHH5_ZIZPA|nr:hypothetical protein GUJ93_ZPchr0011g27471 [Zizania palustris]